MHEYSTNTDLRPYDSINKICAKAGTIASIKLYVRWSILYFYISSLKSNENYFYEKSLSGVKAFNRIVLFVGERAPPEHVSHFRLLLYCLCAWSFRQIHVSSSYCQLVVKNLQAFAEKMLRMCLARLMRAALLSSVSWNGTQTDAKLSS